MVWDWRELVKMVEGWGGRVGRRMELEEMLGLLDEEGA
jgi:hypothetical protein